MNYFPDFFVRFPGVACVSFFFAVFFAVTDFLTRDFPYGLSLKTNQARNVAYCNELRPAASGAQ